MPVEAGSIPQESSGRRGWFLGHFIDPGSDLRHTHDVEVKWHALSEGDGSDEVEDTRTSLCVLIEGCLRIRFASREIVLRDRGDYALWRDEAHRWQVEDHGLVIFIRWPSQV